MFSHAQTVVLCVGCSTVLCQPTGGKARLTEGTDPCYAVMYSEENGLTVHLQYTHTYIVDVLQVCIFFTVYLCVHMHELVMGHS